MERGKRREERVEEACRERRRQGGKNGKTVSPHFKFTLPAVCHNNDGF